jgi:hypothetical protein
MNGFSLPRVQTVTGLERHRGVVKDGVSWVESFRFRLDLLIFRCWLVRREVLERREAT